MQKKIFMLIVSTIGLFSCSSSKKNTSAVSTSFPASTPKSTDEGMSYATAIIIKETSEKKGLDAEHKWLHNHYTHYKVRSQGLGMHDNKTYDIIEITLSNGQERNIFFDISNFYGK
jgi:hypothetical protein